MTKNTLICLSLSLLLLTSCGSKRTLLPNNQSSDISQQQDNGQNFSSDLVIETTGTDFTKVVSKAGKASEDIKLRPSHGTLFNFSVSLDTKSQENNDWTLHRNGNCTGDLTQFDYCVVTVDYHPNQQGAAYAYLDIKYSTDGHNDTNNQFVLINTINTPLIGKSSLFHTNSSLWTQSTFTTAAGSWFINQTLMENEDALHLFNTEDDSYLKINNIEPTNIGIAHIGKDRNYFFYTNFSSQKKMIHDFTQPDKPDVPIQNPLVKLLASGQTHTYGITDSGEISTISADGSSHTVAKINPNKVSTEFFSVDPSNDNTLYGIFFDRELGKNAFYQMNISDSFHFSRSKSPEPDEIQTSFAGQMFQIVPSDFQIFLGVYDPSQYKFSILALDKMTFQFKSWPVIPNLFSKKRPVIAYDTQNKTIFFTTSDESTFTLHAVDTNNGAYQKVYVSSSALSDPFLTKPLNKEQTKIVTLDGAGILRAFQRDSSKEYLAINQYIFNNGKNSLELFPQQSNYTFYPTLTTQSGNFLKTVLSSDLGQNIFPINLNW